MACDKTYSNLYRKWSKLRAAVKPFLDEAWGESDYMHETWNPEAHVELTVTIEECRQLHRAMCYDPRPDPGKKDGAE